MNEIEEKLWNYIDGSCTQDEQKAISQLIEQDQTYRARYHQLLNLNKEISAIEPDEPSMAFTFKVMEAIRTEQARSPLKSVIDQRIIRGIAAFFLFTIIAVLGYILLSLNWSASGVTMQLPQIKFPELKNIFTGPLMKGFVVFDVMLALFLFDTVLRKRKMSKQI